MSPRRFYVFWEAGAFWEGAFFFLMLEEYETPWEEWLGELKCGRKGGITSLGCVWESATWRASWAWEISGSSWQTENDSIEKNRKQNFWATLEICCNATMFGRTRNFVGGRSFLGLVQRILLRNPVNLILCAFLCSTVAKSPEDTVIKRWKNNLNTIWCWIT